jgi:GT2 family glycosyltransferase
MVEALSDPRVVLAGGDIQADPGERALPARYARTIGLLSQEHTLRHPRAPFFQTANLGVRRADALDVGGFDAELAHAGEDADFCWRLVAQHPDRVLRRVPSARVLHRHRTTASGLFRQFRSYGRGDVALARRHGGAGRAEAMKLAADLVRTGSLPVTLLAGCLRAAIARDALPIAAPWLRVVQAAGRRLGQIEGLVRDGRTERTAVRTCP